MAIGVSVAPRLIVAGKVAAVRERRARVSAEDLAAGVVGDLQGHEVVLVQEDMAQVGVRFRAFDKLEVPAVGSFAALETIVSEGSFQDERGRTVEYVNLRATGPAYGALDKIASALNSGSGK